MDTTLLVLVSVLVGGAALGFYMDWFGLWVSEDEMREEMGRVKGGAPRLGTRVGERAPETGARTEGKTGTESPNPRA